MALGPLTVDLMKSIDVSVNVSGGVEPVRPEQFVMVCQELLKMNGDLRSPLKKAGHLRRDPRKSRGRKPGSQKEKVPILQKINLIQKSFTKPSNTNRGFVFLNFK